MTEIRWTESLSTGVETIDLQHKELIDRIRSLSDAVRMRQGTTRTTATLEFLSEYVHMHFSAEEKVMSDASFLELPLHVERHDEFRGTLSKLEDDLLEDGSTDGFAESVNTFLFNWLSDHIMTWDRRLGEHLRASDRDSCGKDGGS